jgi:hypothetical protein
MSPFQIAIVGAAYAAVTIPVVWFTRATSRRFWGGVAGAGVGGAYGMGAIVAGNALALWRVPLPQSFGVMALFAGVLAVTLVPIYLVTWRVARRFGLRGLVVCLVVVAIIGPPRDYAYAAVFPAWMVFGPGVWPILGDAVAYIGMVAIGHAAMWLVSGGANDDGLR